MPESPEQQIARLQAENADLHSLNQKVIRLVNHLAHELRTPLTSITGFSEFLLRNAEKQPPERVRHYCEILFLESSRLSRMVDALLDLSRMRAGKMTLNRIPANLTSLIAHTVQSLHFQAAEKQTELKGAVEPGLPPIAIDPDKVQQILTNLIANAIHYSPHSSKIEVGAKRDGDFLQVWVRDNGIGISPQDQKRIFDEFYRVEDSSTSEEKGTGLGLPITKALVELHGGHIGVDSQPGQGSHFHFTLPLKPPSSQAAPPTPASPPH